jgi:hypothetical protein
MVDAFRPANDAAPPRDGGAGGDGDDGDGDVVELHIQIDGNGRVDIVGGAGCGSEPLAHRSCDLSVVAGVPLMLDARAIGHDMFDRWTTEPCLASPELCAFTPVASIDIGVRFRKQDQ